MDGAYWLIREPGRQHGFDTLPMQAGDETPEQALSRWQDSLEERGFSDGMARILRQNPSEAVLVPPFVTP